MNKQTEVRIIDLVDHVVSGGRCEDDLIECKREFPTEAKKAARQIAGLLNAARGSMAIWIVGLDEGAHEVVKNQGTVDPANWLPQVTKYFRGLDPNPEVRTVITGHGLVTALLFDTERAPYVVTTDGGSGGDLEVPWRVGTGTRSATRAQLLSLLVSTQAIPTVEVINPTLTAAKSADRDATLDFKADLFVSASERVFLPRHRWQLTAHTSEWEQDAPVPLEMRFTPHWRHGRPPPLQRIRGNPNGPEIKEVRAEDYYESEHPYGVHVRQAGLIINGSDSVKLTASAQLNARQSRSVELAGAFSLELHMPVDRIERSVRVDIPLRWIHPPDRPTRDEIGRWVEQR